MEKYIEFLKKRINEEMVSSIKSTQLTKTLLSDVCDVTPKDYRKPSMQLIKKIKSYYANMQDELTRIETLYNVSFNPEGNKGLIRKFQFFSYRHPIKWKGHIEVKCPRKGKIIAIMPADKESYIESIGESHIGLISKADGSRGDYDTIEKIIVEFDEHTKHYSINEDGIKYIIYPKHIEDFKNK